MNNLLKNQTEVSNAFIFRLFPKWSAIASMIAGALYLLIQLIHPTDTLASVSTQSWLIVHVLSLMMDFLALVALSGIQLRQFDRTRWLGFIGYLLFSLFFAMSFAFHFIEAFIYPILLTIAPDHIAGLQGLVTSDPSLVDLGLIPTIYAMTGISYLLGGFILGLSLFRSKAFSKSASLLLSIGSLATILGAFIPHPFDRIMAIPVGVALICLGWEMFVSSTKPVE